MNDAIEKILRSRQITCLFIAHRLSTIARADRIVVLEGLNSSLSTLTVRHLSNTPLPTGGKITETGTFRELVRFNFIWKKAVN